MDFNFAGLFGQAQKVQEEIRKVREELAAASVTGTSGGGMVTVRVNGQFEVLEVRIDPETLKNQDPEFLAELIRSAANQALQNATKLNREKMSTVAGGILSQLPPGFRIPGL